MITLAYDFDPEIYAAGFAVQKSHWDLLNKNGKFIMTFEGKTKLNEWLKENNKKATDFILEEKPKLEPIQVAQGILRDAVNNVVTLFLWPS